MASALLRAVDGGEAADTGLVADTGVVADTVVVVDTGEAAETGVVAEMEEEVETVDKSDLMIAARVCSPLLQKNIFLVYKEI